jgi:hypothetical protein
MEAEKTSPRSQNSAVPLGTAPPDPGIRPEVVRHVTRHVGRPQLVLAEEVSHAVELEVLCVAPRSGQDFWTLVTCGMSDRALEVPPGQKGFPRTELLLGLPPHWKISAEAFRSESAYWPVRLLKRLARLPHLLRGWATWGQVMPYGDAFPEPVSEDAPFYGSVLGYPTHFVPEFEKLAVSGQEIHFLAVYPLYKEEMEFAQKKGPDAVFKRFAQRKITEVVDTGRPNICGKPAAGKGAFAGRA